MNKRDDALSAVYSSPWIGAEGSRNGQPLLIRARHIPDTLLALPEFPYLLVLTFRYASSDDTGLPSEAQYGQIGHFEEDSIDAMEKQRIGVATVVRTWCGSVRYFCYVRNIDEAVAAISRELQDIDAMELAGDEDQTWAEYRRLTAMITAWPS
jgi:hypothetical protein